MVEARAGSPDWMMQDASHAMVVMAVVATGLPAALNASELGVVMLEKGLGAGGDADR